VPHKTQGPVSVWLRPGLLEQLYEEVAKLSEPAEVGGLLLGAIEDTQDGVQLRVEQFEPIDALGGEDKTVLRESIASLTPPLQLLGFLRVRCRPELKVDESDLRLANEHLPNPVGVLLLIQGIAGDGPRSALFVLKDGPAPNEQTINLPLPLPSAPAPRRTRILLASIVILVIAIVGVWMLVQRLGTESRRPESAASSTRQLRLKAYREVGHLRVTWNSGAAPVAASNKGTLTVKDGAQVRVIPLDSAGLQAGSFIYYPHTELTLFELKVGDASDLVLVAGTQKAAQPAKPVEPAKAPVTIEPEPAQVAKASPQPRPPAAKFSINRELNKLTPLATINSPPAAQAAPRQSPPPEMPPPPDLRLAPDSARTAVQLPFPNNPARIPPPAPRGQAGPSEELDFVAAQPVKHVAPQASPNVMRLVVSRVTIRVKVYVDTQGRVVRAESLTRGSSLIDYLSGLCVTAAREWSFRPARRGGNAVESEAVVQFDFDGSG
jgi:protein TonB